MTSEELQEANVLIDELESAVENIDKFSVYHQDLFNTQVAMLEDLIRACRQQLK